jgi:hypothetical protein
MVDLNRVNGILLHPQTSSCAVGFQVLTLNHWRADFRGACTHPVTIYIKSNLSLANAKWVQTDRISAGMLFALAVIVTGVARAT